MSALSREALQRGAWWAVTLLVLLSSLPKAGLIVAPRADLFPKGSKSESATFKPEELDNGTVAIDVLEGPIVPLIDYQHAPYFGGSLVVGILAIPFFALLGPTLVALKLTTLVWNALLVAFTFLILDRFISRRAAWFGGLLAALPPPGYATMSVIAWGSHLELNGLMLAILWLYLIAYERDTARLVPVFLCGVAAGLAVYFGFLAALLIALLIFVRFLSDKLFFARKDALVALLGFVIGFTPWILYNVRHDFSSMLAFQHAAGTDVAPLTLADRLERARTAVTSAFPRSFFFTDLGPIAARQLELAFALTLGLLALGALACGGLARNLAAPLRALVRREAAPVPLVVLCWGFPLVFLLAYSGQVGFSIGDQPDRVTSYRYLTVLYPFLWITAAISLDRLAQCRARAGRTLATGLVLTLTGVGALANLHAYDFERFGLECEKPGYSRQSLGRFLVGTYAREPELVLSAARKAEAVRTEAELTELYSGMARYLGIVQVALPERLDPRMQRDLAHYEALRARLEETVAERYQHFFAPMERGQRWPVLEPRISAQPGE